MVLEVVRAGICGTDLGEFSSGPHLFPSAAHPASGQRLPITMGHEFVGRVVALGAGVESFARGERVACGAGVSCGRCAWCRRGETNLCSRYYTLGFQADGGLGERVLVPADICLPVPDGVSDDNAALAQPLAVAAHAYRRTVHPDAEPLLLLGVGAIGSLYLAVAKQHGVTVLAADRNPLALERAEALGADRVVDLRGGDLARAVEELVGAEGLATAVDCTGRPEMVRMAAELVRRGGTLMLVGLQAEPVALDLHDFVLREITVRTSNAHVFACDFPEALAILAARDLSRVLLDRVIALDDLVEHGILPSLRGETHGKVLVAP
jgi:(R,R)-butanediol dehydrogenase/meso-butanediol dehydrogenase/diacetyl reductase